MKVARIDKLGKIAIHGVPRSGTSWLGEIFNSCPTTVYRYQPLFSYAHKDCLSSESSSGEIDKFFSRLRYCDDDFTNQIDRRRSGDFPNFAKQNISHVVYKEVRYHHLLHNLMRRSDDLMLCAIIRNPLSTINSWLLAPREFRRDLGWSEREEWRTAPLKNRGRPEEFNGYEKWKEATNIFVSLGQLYPDRVYLQRYSRLVANPISEVGSLFEKFGLEFTSVTADFLRKSVTTDSSHAYSVFRSHPDDGAWKTELDGDIAKEIMADLCGTALEEYLVGENTAGA